MELLLNLLWLAVVSTLVIQVWKRRAASEEASHNLLIFGLALVCIAALIFPAISMTDDLHLECMIVENPTKRILQATPGLDHSPGVFAVSLLLLLIASLRLMSAHRLSLRLQFSPVAPLDGFLRPAAGRAPPRHCF